MKMQPYRITDNLRETFEEYSYDRENLIRWFNDYNHTLILNASTYYTPDSGTVAIDHKEIVDMSNYQYMVDKYGDLFGYIITSDDSYVTVHFANIQIPSHLVALANSFFCELANAVQCDVKMLSTTHYTNVKAMYMGALLTNDAHRVIAHIYHYAKELQHTSDPRGSAMSDVYRRLKKIDVAQALQPCLATPTIIWESEELTDRYMPLTGMYSFADVVWLRQCDNDPVFQNNIIEWFLHAYPEPVDDQQLALF